MYDDDCQEKPRAVLLGATNSWFPITLSALAIPLARDPFRSLFRTAGNTSPISTPKRKWCEQERAF
jgi:hypothetical protein